MAKPCYDCQVCGGESVLLLVTWDRNQHTSEEHFSYMRCKVCGLIFLSKIPSSLDRYYPNKYYSLPASLEELAKLAEPERYRIEIVQQFITAGRFLEIGPAYGILAYLAKEAGFTVDAIEMDARCCNFLAHVVGVHVIQSSHPQEALQNKGPYDVIVMRHVLEHLAEPWECLRQVASTLAPGGILCISTPNPDALQFKVLRSFWWHIDSPRHLQLIPSKLLVNQLGKLGLDPMLLTCNDRGGLDCNRAGWAISLANLVPSALAKKGLRAVGKVVNMLVKPYECAGLNGSAYTLVVRKEERGG